MKVKDIYNILDAIASFEKADKHDNSGLLIGDGEKNVTKVIITLDITNKVIEEAVQKGAELIVSHHPVIYNPIYTLSTNDPVYNLAKHEISAICSHSPMDMSSDGINGILFDMLKDQLGLCSDRIILEEVYGGFEPLGYGWICSLQEKLPANKIAELVKNILGCTVVRYTDGGYVNKLALCSGSGGSMLNKAIEKGADGFITGDVKHDQMISAYNKKISLFDCGHFHTENVLTGFLQKKLSEKCLDVEFINAKNNHDVVKYEI